MVTWTKWQILTFAHFKTTVVSHNCYQWTTKSYWNCVRDWQPYKWSLCRRVTRRSSYKVNIVDRFIAAMYRYEDADSWDYYCYVVWVAKHCDDGVLKCLEMVRGENDNSDFLCINYTRDRVRILLYSCESFCLKKVMKVNQTDLLWLRTWFKNLDQLSNFGVVLSLIQKLRFTIFNELTTCRHDYSIYLFYTFTIIITMMQFEMCCQLWFAFSSCLLFQTSQFNTKNYNIFTLPKWLCLCRVLLWKEHQS